MNVDKLKVRFLKKLLPRSDWAREELAKVLLPKSPHSIWLGWDDVDMGNKRLKRVDATRTSKPTAGPDWEGEIIRVRSGAGAKTYIYTCVQNSADGWEWVQIGVST